MKRKLKINNISDFKINSNFIQEDSTRSLINSLDYKDINLNNNQNFISLNFPSNINENKFKKYLRKVLNLRSKIIN